MIAYDYPLLGIFWTTLVIFLWIAWFMLLFRVIFDIFRSDDLGGLAKALWLIFVIFLPFLGVLVYVIARGHKITEHDVAHAQRAGAGVPVLRAADGRHRWDGRGADQAGGAQGPGRPQRRRVRAAEGQAPQHLSWRRRATTFVAK